MNTFLKWLLGLGLLGGGLWYVDKNIIGLGLTPNPKLDPIYSKQFVIDSAQRLLVLFQKNRGVDLSGRNEEQKRNVRFFQIATNGYQTSIESKSPPLREDGIWDSATSAAFLELTGYSPLATTIG